MLPAVLACGHKRLSGNSIIEGQCRNISKLACLLLICGPLLCRKIPEADFSALIAHSHYRSIGETPQCHGGERMLSINKPGAKRLARENVPSLYAMATVTECHDGQRIECPNGN